MHRGYGRGQVCDGCGERILPAQTQYELDYNGQGFFRLHIGCAGLWDAECRRRGHRGFVRPLVETTQHRCVSCGTDHVVPIALEHTSRSGPIRMVHRCSGCDAIFVVVRPRPGAAGAWQREDVLPVEFLLRCLQRKLTDGTLANSIPDRLSVAPAAGAPCLVCDRPILSPDVEVEYESPIGSNGVLHARCYQLWIEECRRLAGS
jgi:hypothetical protein